MLSFFCDKVTISFYGAEFLSDGQVVAKYEDLRAYDVGYEGDDKSYSVLVIPVFIKVSDRDREDEDGDSEITDITPNEGYIIRAKIEGAYIFVEAVSDS